MRAVRLRGLSHSERSGAILIIMVLLIVVLCTLIWLDPMALMSNSGSGMPWNEERRLVRPDEEVKQPKEGQPKILDNLFFAGQIVEDNEVKGGVELYILTDGRIKGMWGGIYKPKPEITWEVTGSRFRGNIDPSKIYSDKDGEDPRKLYFIAKGKFLILETNSETGKIKTATGAIYVTGWLDNEYSAVGKVTITSDKKNYTEYFWQGKGKKALMIPDFGPSLPGLF
ncbi:MAG: hypothetical protein MUP16_07175 [Sedimentisphaerales bacterium]|nr:hypothetical protein [Sedimentisphaerales bacterium]